MKTLRNIAVALIIIAALFAVSYFSKPFLSRSKPSIVTEFLNIRLTKRLSSLLFLGRSIAASQYYQSMAILYFSSMQMPHYHMADADLGSHEKDQAYERSDDLKSADSSEVFVAFLHGTDGKTRPITQDELDRLKEKESYIISHAGTFIDTSHFYNLIYLAYALDPNNDFILSFGRGFILNSSMAKDMIRVLIKAYEIHPQWRTLFDAGWISLYELRDYEQSKKFLKKAFVDHPDAPDFIREIYKHSFSSINKHRIAWAQTAKDMSRTEDHGLLTRLEKRFRWHRHLYDLNKAAFEYQERFTNQIQKVADLVSAGIISSVPEDPIGKGFIWDPQNNEVVSKSIEDLSKTDKDRGTLD